MNLDCPNPKCGKQAPRLIATAKGLGCVYCIGTPKGMDAIIGRVRFKKWGVRVTECDAMNIKTNRKREDGQYRPDPRWRDSGA